MEIEADRVIKLVFPEGLPDNLENNPDLAEYLHKLGSYKVENLNKEQSRLTDEQHVVVEQIQDLAVSNYKTFIQTAECSREIFKEFKQAEDRLDSVIYKLPEFSIKCEKFAKTSSDINSHRRLNSLTLTRNAQLLEILELPQLMDTCIRQGQFEEALELSAYVQRLGGKHGNIPIIKSIVSDMEKSWQTMLQQLLAQLRTDLQLPKCLQVVGYLRRMEAFTEPELRLKFLQARDSWLSSLLANISGEDPQQHLSKTIEVSRVHLFNTVTQYKAIFNDEDQSGQFGSSDPFINEPCIFYSWLQEKVAQFLTTLELDLSRGVSSLESALGQCMYFGLAFSRVGADFRGLIAPIVVKTTLQNFNTAIQNITQKFENDMESFTLINKIHTFVRSQPDTSGVNPPETLLDFYPLAEYCNGLLASFNDLRLCAPHAIADAITSRVQNSLEMAANIILVFYKQEQQAFMTSEKESFLRLCTCFAYDFVPYIQRCLHVIYPPHLLATFLGISTLMLQKEGISHLKIDNILKCIKHLLPDRIETVLNSTEPAIVEKEVLNQMTDSIIENLTELAITEVTQEIIVNPDKTIEEGKIDF